MINNGSGNGNIMRKYVIGSVGIMLGGLRSVVGLNIMMR